MHFNRKGTELSMNVVIIAAIAILVLVILAMFLFRSSNRMGEGTSCDGMGGSCEPVCGGEYPLPMIGMDDSCGMGAHCCLPLGATTRRN